jgi:hypothetical protein
LLEGETPLERNHLRYLLMQDSEINDIMRNDKGIKVHFQLFLYAFGLFQHSIEDIKEFE